MEDRIASVSEGYEVSHSKYGRGCIVETLPETALETGDVEVLFYRDGETRETPIYAISPASESVTHDIRDGTHGLSVTIDDGFYTLYIEPDQEGTGFNVALRAGNADIDSAHLDTAEFL